MKEQGHTMAGFRIVRSICARIETRPPGSVIGVEINILNLNIQLFSMCHNVLQATINCKTLLK